MELQEWLFLILSTAIVGLILHGLWTKYYGSDRLPLKLDKQFVSDRSDLDPEEALQQFKAELPNGGARIVKVGDSSIPVGESIEKPSAPPVEPTASPAADASVMSAETGDFFQAELADEPQDASLVPADALSESEEGQTIQENPELFLVLNVLGSIQGQALLEALMSLDFEYSDKGIFQRREVDESPSISVANAVEPGTFDLATIDQFESPGVIFLMAAHDAVDPVNCFETMLKAAAFLADELGAKLCDDRRSAVTEQTIAHLRQQVQEHQFKRSR